MPIPLSTFVQISTTVATAGTAPDVFGQGLLISIDPGLSAGGSERVRRFSTAAAAADVLQNEATLDSVNVWFAQQAKPLYVMRWALTSVESQIVGGTPTADVGDFDEAVSTFRLRGVNFTVDLSSVSTHADVATAVQAQLVTQWPATTVTFANGIYTVTFPNTETYGLFSPTGSANDISADLGLDAGSNAVFTRGSATETIVNAVTDVLGLVTNGRPVGLMLTGDAPLTQGAGENAIDTREALAAYAQANNLVFGLRETAAAALELGETASHSAEAFARSQNNVAAVFADADEHPEIGALSLMSSQNLDSPASVVNPHGKVLPGVLPVNITEEQLAELQNKRVSVYTTVGGRARFLEGYTSRDGHWLDTTWWLMWFQNRLEVAQWDAIGSARVFTAGLLQDEILQVVDDGIANGGIEPGRAVSNATRNDIRTTTGNRDFDGVLTTGAALWIDPEPSSADLADRAARWKLWVVGTRRINRTFGDLIFAN